MMQQWAVLYLFRCCSVNVGRTGDMTSVWRMQGGPVDLKDQSSDNLPKYNSKNLVKKVPTLDFGKSFTSSQ
ncbi:unnamed protein product [Acanthoscelides obtectus]|uniref:Uncharacterized protein n=1 Tax=Acanthoscelides obtectus TaxID=200917 RepID=A0A9P0M602_ACAOB|nr:unnamed protein product [Acanthoscelides obtectus]CAK1668698.1 hypothetical protein AOBTE_LOCUS26543 [Acanthoscelides obtectus]